MNPSSLPHLYENLTQWAKSPKKKQLEGVRFC